MKKILICFLLILTLSVPGFADGNSSTEVIDTSAINLERINFLPDGVTPIEINSQKEFDEFVKKATAETYTNSKSVIKIIPRLYSGSSTSVSVSTSKLMGGVIYLNLNAVIDVYINGSFGQINGYNAWTSLTGYTVGTTWTENYIKPNISADKQSITLTSYGTLKHYLLISGVVEMWSEDTNISLSYHL
ncbi:hypothetical protein [Fusibacter sp. 3D3]|uniref:hypothetical protein n=1 Tax=Fusibacter sp. 3D3 TaxID=1048380 RepID=UPI000853A7C0|nr:hypothetical protein [Fusibacter sp. 3D3]GAU78337.1 hypothetical protein F3D3_2970 [Fusibacter sp. 3D3]